MEKKIIVAASMVGIVSLFIAGAYYVAVFLPQKQMAEIEKSKLELEARIEQDDKLKEAQEIITNRDNKITEQEQLIEQQKAEIEKIKHDQSKSDSASAIRKSCNASAIKEAQKLYKEFNPDDNSGNYASVYYEKLYNACIREKGL